MAERLRRARRVTVLTGAGVSAASGVPTFRGAGGLWRSFRSEDLATAQAFERDPALVWEWYAWRREAMASARPNAAHHVLAAWSRRWSGFVVITQNVDDLHVHAGTLGLVRLHGSLWELSCWRGCGAPPWRNEDVPLPEMPPLCPSCGGLARPAVVWFGEALPSCSDRRGGGSVRVRRVPVGGDVVGRLSRRVVPGSRAITRGVHGGDQHRAHAGDRPWWTWR